MGTDQYVGIEAVANYFNVSISTVRNWIKSNTIPASLVLKIGHTHRFKIADIEAALKGSPEPASAVQPDISDSTQVQLELDFNPDEDI
jgi:excisionase family DNA binding protein